MVTLLNFERQFHDCKFPHERRRKLEEPIATTKLFLTQLKSEWSKKLNTYWSRMDRNVPNFYTVNGQSVHSTITTYLVIQSTVSPMDL